MLQKTLKIIKNSAIIAFIIVIISFFIKLIPCIKESKFSLCTIPNPFLDLPNSPPQFYNISNNPILALILQFFIALILILLIILFSKSKPKKVIDFTKNKI
jgi:hypothetical protein